MNEPVADIPNTNLDPSKWLDLQGNALNAYATSFRDKLKMWVHLVLCGTCLRFRSNAIAIQRRVNELEERAKTNHGTENARLSDEAKEKIRITLEHKS